MKGVLKDSSGTWLTKNMLTRQVRITGELLERLAHAGAVRERKERLDDGRSATLYNADDVRRNVSK